MVLSQSACCNIFILQATNMWLRTSIQPQFGWLYNSYLSCVFAGCIVYRFMCLISQQIDLKTSPVHIVCHCQCVRQHCRACDIRTPRCSAPIKRNINRHLCVTGCHIYRSLYFALILKLPILFQQLALKYGLSSTEHQQGLCYREGWSRGGILIYWLLFLQQRNYL
jgi:hypothetical protein